MFHVTLFPIAPTAALGMIPTLIAWMTGSVFPGMLLHAGNNAIGVLGGNLLSLEVLRWCSCSIAGASLESQLSLYRLTEVRLLRFSFALFPL